MGVRDAIDPHITFTTHYSEWDAAVAAGATLDELLRLDEYPKSFRAKLIAWHGYHKAIDMHAQDAVSQKMRRGSKR